MQFYTSSRPGPSRNAQYPCVHLRIDNWDDYTFGTTFNGSYHEDASAQIPLPDIKILDKTSKKTVLPDSFTKLTGNFCSLGQSLDYYKALVALGEDTYGPILIALNDVVYNPDIVPDFLEEEGFEKSLLRFSEAEKAFREAGSLFRYSHESGAKEFAFSFTCSVPGAESAHTMSFDFTPDLTGLHRITALIGRNGTGKTQVLANFAHAMSGLKPNAGVFQPRRPSFSKVVAISYSIFDDFERPPEHRKTFSYKFCGIREGSRLLSPDRLKQNLDDALEEIEGQERLPQWQEVISTLLNVPIDATEVRDSEGSLKNDFYQRLSSGQRMLVLVMSQVIANIAAESMILFDEPEIHLHPNAVSALARALHLLLERFSSYAIIATHSPIILQEVPSRYVRVFRREGNMPQVTPLAIESFGESLTTITNNVFEIEETRHNYRDHLQRMVETLGVEQILAAFGGRLSFNARTYLRAIAAEHEEHDVESGE